MNKKNKLYIACPSSYRSAKDLDRFCTDLGWEISTEVDDGTELGRVLEAIESCRLFMAVIAECATGPTMDWYSLEPREAPLDELTAFKLGYAMCRGKMCIILNLGNDASSGFFKRQFHEVRSHAELIKTLNAVKRPSREVNEF